MRRFKLLKDLPGIEAGTVLVTDGSNDDDGCGLLLIDCDDALKPETGFCLFRDDFFGPHKGGRRTPIGNWMEELPEEYKRWRADDGGDYYFVDDEGDIDFREERNRYYDDGRYKMGNYFGTYGEAENYANYLKALAVVRDDAKGFEPDWSDIEQEKWYVRYALEIECLFNSETEQYVDNGVFGLPYFETEEDARASIDKHEKEWLTIFGVKDETESDDE